MTDTLKLVVGIAFLALFAWQFRHWFGGSWSVRRGLLFRLGGAALGALAPVPIEIGIPVGYVIGIAVSLTYNSVYEE
jgi:hypothetical protein